MRLNSLREHLNYYAEVSLPHRILTPGGTGPSTFDSPISVRWLNASNHTIRSSDYKVIPSIYVPLSGYYGTGIEIARSAATHHISGLVQSTRRWHNVAEDDSYETTFEYDPLGRLLLVTDSEGTISRTDTYDILDRALTLEIGSTESGGTPLLVAEYFYDSHGTASQGVGNGMLTFIREYTGDDGTLAADQRDTIRTFDFRDRLTGVQSPAAPHEAIAYDNLDRATARAIFSSVPTGGVGGTEDADRGLYTETLYSQRGLPYRRRIALNPADLDDGFLESNSWFDSVGRTIAEWSPNSPGVKHTFDGHGRTTALYITDRAEDDAPGAGGNYADAASLTDDRVVEQTEHAYDEDDRLTLTTTRRRRHDASPTADTGALTGSNSIATYVGFLYDGAGRATNTLNFGTNIASSNIFIIGGNPPTVLDPASTDERLVSSVSYNARGLVERSTDPAGKVSKTFFDDLSRPIATVENLVEPDPDEPITIVWGSDRWAAVGLDDDHPDQNRVTSVVYDGVDNVVKQVAHLPTSNPEVDDAQITEYTYGVTPGAASTKTNSLIASNGLLHTVQYPDESTGDPGTGSMYTVTYSYNKLGELRSVTDQNGTVHAYHRDLLGRVTADQIHAFSGSSPGNAIDQGVKRLGVAYDGLGRLSSTTSYSDTSGTTAVNGVAFGYTGLWQPARIYQNHAGAATYNTSTLEPTGSTRWVRQTFANAAPAAGDPGSNFSRLASLIYPDGLEVISEYGAAESIDDRISRASALSSPGVSAYTSIVEYHRVGLDLTALVDYAAADVQLDRTFDQTGARDMYGTQAAGAYPGLDRFGRVAVQAWMDGGLTTSGGLPTKPPLVDEVYSYDRASSRTLKNDARPGVQLANKDYRYEYDGLDRLARADRGVKGSGTNWTQGIGGQKWTLDVLGNWKEVFADLDGDGDYESPAEKETRDHNMANELLERQTIPSGSGPDLPFAYDHAGNRRECAREGGSSINVYTHDAWNRLVKVQVAGTGGTQTLGEYEYNPLHWRTLKRRPEFALGEEDLGQQRLMYYDAAWRLIHEEADDAYSSTPGVNRVAQTVFGLRYIDDPVLRRQYDPNNEVYASNLHYHLTDVQYSTIAMIGVGTNPVLHERVRYTPYGEARHAFPSDFNEDGVTNATDQALLTAAKNANEGSSAQIGDAEYDSALDLNRDGVITSSDQTQYNWWSGLNGGVGLLSGQISNSGTSPFFGQLAPDNVFGYCGYVFNAETRLNLARHRTHDPVTGGWLERDPMQYIEGMNQFQYVLSVPTRFLDPAGKLRHDTSELHSTNAPDSLLTRLSNCVDTCHRRDDAQSFWTYDFSFLTRCRNSCARRFLTSSFWSCDRNIRKDGADLGDAVLITIADFLENHGFISYGLDPNLTFAYALQGNEKQNDPPSHERGFPGKSAVCYRCYRKQSPLLYGDGAGKSGYDATDEEIKNCIKGANLKQDYSALGYNCNVWLRESLSECGLVCDGVGYAVLKDGRIERGWIEFKE